MTALIRTTSPGATPATLGKNRFALGWYSGRRSFQTLTTAAGVVPLPARRRRYVLSHICPKPWIGPATRLPLTLRLIAPVGTWPTSSRATGFAQYGASRGESGTSSQRLCFAVENTDRVVQARQRKDLAIMFAE